MNQKTIQIGICAIVLIALLFSAGCTFPSGGDTATPTVSTTPVVTTKMPTVKMTTAVIGVPTSAVAVTETTDPWANFVEPTTLPGEEITEEATEVVTEEPTAEVTEAETVAEEVPLTEEPTAVPTIPSVASTCSNIGGNVCLANEKCSGAFIKTTDEPLCCAGICESQ